MHLCMRVSEQRNKRKWEEIIKQYQQQRVQNDFNLSSQHIITDFHLNSNCKKKEICEKKISNVTFKNFVCECFPFSTPLLILMQNILLFTMSHEFLIIQEDLLLHFSPITICKTNYITTSKQRTKLHLMSHKDNTYMNI